MTLQRSHPRAKQRWVVLLAIVALLSALGVGSALAVHDAGAFELDTPSANATDDAGTTGEDWDLICKANPSTCTFAAGYTPPAGTTTAVSSSHVKDVTGAGAESLTATIFTGGGSKDGQDISSWLWKDDAGGLPDKDNLLHAYAARYSIPKSTACPAPETATNCELIYFGSDRYANDGDATQAFWFLQNQITLNGPSSKGGTQFTGVHRNGDLLIISEFSNGGTKSTITVYTWQNGTLQLEAGGDDQRCGLQASDPFCGIVNTNLEPTISPWTFLDKAGSSSFRQGELYESGINLSHPDIALAEECFSSFVAETRSSTSVTATLKDFVLGQFQSCQPAMTTTASTNGTVAPGTSVTDVARITVTGAANPPDPTGTVTFFLCSNATNGCPTGGTNVGTGALANQSGGSTTDGIAEATSPPVNSAGSPLSPGRYCFRAEWPGSTTYPGALSHTNNTTECFSVQDTTSITTAQKWLPQDTATIATGSGAAAPTGTVVFSLYENGTCSGTPATTFTDTTAPYETNNTSYETESTVISWSATFTPSAGSGFAGSTTTMCERSDLTINNSASVFPPPAP